jgi:hypothetical protein
MRKELFPHAIFCVGYENEVTSVENQRRMDRILTIDGSLSN